MSNQGDPFGKAEPLVEVSRGPLVESVHQGHLVAVTPLGEAIAWLGNPDVVTFFRSSAKPLQAIPLVSSGAADHFEFTEREIAIACGSHSGESIHVETVRAMLEKLGLNESALRCGVHEPFSIDVARQLIRDQQPPSVLQNNCSGKHAGMLALAKHIGAPIETYDELQNPVQQLILNTVSEFSGVPADKIAIGIDGCAVPVFGISVRAMALAYARLVLPPPIVGKPKLAACERIVKAMLDFPEMVGGTKNRLDTELIKAGQGRLISKIGAEGVYTVGVLPCRDWPQGLGLALKIADGDDQRARPPAVIDALRQLEVLAANDLDSLSGYSPTPIRNRRGDRVGEIRAAFHLKIKHPQ